MGCWQHPTSDDLYTSATCACGSNHTHCLECGVQTDHCKNAYHGGATMLLTTAETVYYAIRYCLTRRSYAFEDGLQLIRTHWAELPRHEQRLLWEELQRTHLKHPQLADLMDELAGRR